MKFDIVHYVDVGKDEWSGYLNEIPEAGYHHSWQWMSFISNFTGFTKNLSFLLFEHEEKKLSAICTLAVSFNALAKYNEISFGGNYCATPLVADVKPNIRRKILDEVFQMIQFYANQYNVKKILMIWDPLVRSLINDSSFHRNQFELQRYGLFYVVKNYLSVDLSLPVETLVENISKYHRRHINRSGKKGVTIKIFNQQYQSSLIPEYFGMYKKAHFISSGRLTRPQETWDLMRNGLITGEASLFVAFVNAEPISFLYCGEFEGMAFGWSQVNIDEYEVRYSPRHILEWNAILYYKENKFRYYELGARHFTPQPFDIPTNKEISVSVYKERFGGFMLPKIFWTGYFDGDVMASEVNAQLNNYLSASRMVKIPES